MRINPNGLRRLLGLAGAGAVVLGAVAGSAAPRASRRFFQEDRPILRGYRPLHPGEEEWYPPLLSPNGRFVMLATGWTGDGGSAGYPAWTTLLDRTTGKAVAAFSGEGQFINNGKQVLFWHREYRAPARGLWLVDLSALPARPVSLQPLEPLGRLEREGSTGGIKNGVRFTRGWHLPQVRVRRVYPLSEAAEEEGAFDATGASYHAATDEIVCARLPAVENGPVGIYAIRLRDGRVRRLAPFGKYPEWSPDGRWVAFHDSGDRPGGNESRPWLVSSDGRVWKSLPPGLLVGWAGSTGDLFYRKKRPGGPPPPEGMDLVRYSPRTGRETVAVPKLAWGDFSQLSPSGRRLAAVTKERLWVLDTRNGAVQTLPQTGVTTFAWGRTDAEIQYVFQRPNGLSEWRQVRLRAAAR